MQKLYERQWKSFLKEAQVEEGIRKTTNQLLAGQVYRELAKVIIKVLSRNNEETTSENHFSKAENNHWVSKHKWSLSDIITNASIAKIFYLYRISEINLELNIREESKSRFEQYNNPFILNVDGNADLRYNYPCYEDTCPYNFLRFKLVVDINDMSEFLTDINSRKSVISSLLDELRELADHEIYHGFQDPKRRRTPEENHLKMFRYQTQTTGDIHFWSDYLMSSVEIEAYTRSAVSKYRRKRELPIKSLKNQLLIMGRMFKEHYMSEHADEVQRFKRMKNYYLNEAETLWKNLEEDFLNAVRSHFKKKWGFDIEELK